LDLTRWISLEDGRIFAYYSAITAAVPMIIDTRTIFASTAACMLLIGCGESSRTPASSAAPASTPDVTITFDGKRGKCVVALPSEAQGSTIACREVLSFVKDELRVPNKATYDIRKIPNVDETEVAKVSADLNSAGYRLVGAPDR
jgi:hypothetical protein